jgi:uncharacterized OB-fold protein
MKYKKGRGSVSRSFRMAKRYETDKKFRERMKERSKINHTQRIKRIDNRCEDCGVLISPKSKRCKPCSIKNNRKVYLNKQNTYKY